jgi:3-hydroxyisobutyrate dehydrogenase-like beta-hydroxyacid dehydrogenase
MIRVGFVGLGSQGAPMARRIVESGFPLTLWARRPLSLEPFRDTEAVAAATLTELGSASDIVGICVVADRDVEEVVLGEVGILAGMARGGVVVIHSTVHPVTCQRIAEHAAPLGVAVVDAPVSGGGGAAAARSLLVMAGGDEQDVERCRPVLETFGNPIVHLGPIGSGQVAKLLNNLVFTAQLSLAEDTYTLAGELGIDPGAMAKVLASGSGGSRAAGIVAGAGFVASGMRHAASLLEKDVGIALELAENRGVLPPESLVALARRSLAAASDGRPRE